MELTHLGSGTSRSFKKTILLIWETFDKNLTTEKTNTLKSFLFVDSSMKS